MPLFRLNYSSLVKCYDNCFKAIYVLSLWNNAILGVMLSASFYTFDGKGDCRENIYCRKVENLPSQLLHLLVVRLKLPWPLNKWHAMMLRVDQYLNILTHFRAYSTHGKNWAPSSVAHGLNWLSFHLIHNQTKPRRLFKI